MSTPNNDVEKGVTGGTEAETPVAHSPSGRKFRSISNRGKEDAYLERFWNCCREYGLHLTQGHFKYRGDSYLDYSKVEELAMEGSQHRKGHMVHVVHDIGLKDVGQLGARLDIDPGFFAHHFQDMHDFTDECPKPTRYKGTIELPKTTIASSYWSIPVVTLSPQDSKSAQRICNSSWRLSFTILKNGNTLLLVKDAPLHFPDFWTPGDIIGTISIYREVQGIESPVRAAIYGDSICDADTARLYFERVLSISPTPELLRSLVSSNTSSNVACDAFKLILQLTTWEYNLEHLAIVARQLEFEATANPSKNVLERLNKARSLTLQVLNDVVQQRKTIRGHSPSKYELLCDTMAAVKQQHPEIGWIPKPQSTKRIDVAATKRAQNSMASAHDSHDQPEISLLLRMLSRQEQQAEKQLAHLRETFQTLTTAIAIKDSEFNKKQAERSTMLALLAAIYLPLTLATGIFGMNIQEINGGTPRWWVVIIVTAVLFLPSLFFMVILFAGEGMKQRFQDRNEHFS